MIVADSYLLVPMRQLDAMVLYPDLAPASDAFLPGGGSRLGLQCAGTQNFQAIETPFAGGSTCTSRQKAASTLGYNNNNN